MSLRQYRIPMFYGLNQGITENRISEGESPDACNMDTSGGRLSVAKGYVRESEVPFSTPEAVQRLFVWNRAEAKRFLVSTADGLFVLDQTAGEWKRLYTFSPQNSEKRCDFQVLKIASTEYLVVASGACQMAKWDGVSESAAAFGSAEGLSDIAVNFCELYYSRLFAAGDADNPARLYYSQAPGDTRTLENWASAEESENAGGGHVEIGADSDPITGLFALSNQLLIFKRDSLYRLLGDRPSNYRILPVSGSVQLPCHTACARSGDVVYFLTENGMYYYDGQTVCRKGDAEKASAFLKTADLAVCDAAACRDKLYFAVTENAGSGANDAMLVYDLSRGTYMARRGFLARGLCVCGGVLYLMDGAGCVCRFDEGETYGGARIDAYWKTPMTDLDTKAVNKHLEELFLRGTGGILSLEAVTEGGTVYNERLMPGSGENILELRLTGDGRAFQLVFRNVNGSYFSVDGGVELLMDLQRRII